VLTNPAQHPTNKRKFMYQAKNGQPVPEAIKNAMQQVRTCQLMPVASAMARVPGAVMPGNLSNQDRQTLVALLKKQSVK
jgi:hypothetical protein